MGRIAKVGVALAIGTPVVYVCFKAIGFCGEASEYRRMSGELTNLIAILGVGIALATLMFALFRIQERRLDKLERRIDKLETTVQQLVMEVAELKGALNVIRDGLRLRVSDPTE